MNKQQFRAIVSLLLTAVSTLAVADPDTSAWTPDPKFRIEDSNYIETLIFISGISYALSSSSAELARAKKQNFFCPPSGNAVGSKLLIDILNERHSGSITSEQAIETIVRGLKVRYPCQTMSYNTSLNLTRGASAPLAG